MIFLVTLIESDNEKANIRCPGYFNSLNLAQGAIIHNDFDLHEESYKYAVIEIIDQGLYRPANRIWYRWEDNHYVLIDKKEIPKWSLKIYGSFVIN